MRARLRTNTPMLLFEKHVWPPPKRLSDPSRTLAKPPPATIPDFSQTPPDSRKRRNLSMCGTLLLRSLAHTEKAKRGNKCVPGRYALCFPTCCAARVRRGYSQAAGYGSLFVSCQHSSPHHYTRAVIATDRSVKTYLHTYIQCGVWNSQAFLL